MTDTTEVMRTSTEISRVYHVTTAKVAMGLDRSTAFSLLAKAKNLKNNEDYGQVFIVPDRSRENRIEHRKLVEQVKLIRTQTPEKRCYI